MTLTQKEYEELVADRPKKFSPDDVNYREADGNQKRCGKCIHFYVRLADRLTTCEIMRSDETDENGVDPEFVCDFFTKDGEEFPMQRK
jgi:hypothetical protein